MLTSLIEGEIDEEIIELMVGSLDFIMMKNRMLTVFKRFVEKILDTVDVDVRDLPMKRIFDKL